MRTLTDAELDVVSGGGWKDKKKKHGVVVIRDVNLAANCSDVDQSNTIRINGGGNATITATFSNTATVTQTATAG